MKNYFELTDPQKNIWNTELFYKNTNVNNIGGHFIFKNADLDLISETLNLLVKNLPVYRIHIQIVDGTPQQFISDYKPFNLETIKFNNLKELEQYEKEYLNTPFDIFDSDLFRFTLFTLKDGHSGFIGLLHHLITDAWSSGLFLSDFIDIYTELLNRKYKSELISNKNNFMSLSDSEIILSRPNYLDYIDKEHDYYKSDRYNKDKEFWDNCIKEYHEPCLISEFNTSNNTASNRIEYKLNIDLYNKIQEYCKSNKSSIYTFFMAIYTIYLSKTLNRKDVIVGTPVLNRTNFEEKNMPGMFIKTVPFVTSVPNDINFVEYLKQINLQQLSIFRHQKYPYSQITEYAKEHYELSNNLFDFVFSYQNATDNKDKSSLEYETTWHGVDNITNAFEVHFYDMDGSNNPYIYYNYQVDKFEKIDIENFHSRILHIINQIIENDELGLDSISVLPENELKTINEFNKTDDKGFDGKLPLEMLEKVIKNNKNKLALIFEDKKLTYGELDQIIDNKCKELQHFKTNEIYAIDSKRSIDTVVSMLACIRSGICYSLSKFDDTSLHFDYPVEKPIYIISTSGSTGKPKAIAIKPISVSNMIYGYRKRLNIDKYQNFISTCEVSFDMFQAEVLIPILLGKTLVLANDEENKNPLLLSELISKYNIEFMLITPSKLSLLLDSKINSCLKCVKSMQLGGENPSERIIEKVLEISPKCQIFNGYGPAETTNCVTTKLINDKKISIGKPYPNTKVYICHKNNSKVTLCPINVPGEIYISGLGVSNGYLHNQEKNEKRFIENPFSTSDDDKILYKTGDIARLDNDGNIKFIGRKDFQIKFRGQRVELGAITSIINELPYVANAITVVMPINKIDNICSYVLLNNAASKNFSNDKCEVTIDKDQESEIKKILSDKLPHYMVPSHIVFVNNFPKTSAGKINIKKLPDIKPFESKFIEATSYVEKRMSIIWQKLLNLPKISVTSNFFENGGDSLLAIQMISEIYSTFDIKLQIKDIFDNPTIRKISKIIESRLNNYEHLGLKMTKAEKRDIYELSHSQIGVYLESTKDETNTLYNTPSGIIFNKMPDVNKLEQALNKVLNAHDEFKAYFINDNGKIIQRIKDKVDFKLEVKEGKNENFVSHFDLSKPPLIHAELNMLGNKCLLQIDIHHIIADGYSINIFIDELCKYYNNETVETNELDYTDYIVFCETHKNNDDYFVNKYKNLSTFDFPTEFTRPTFKSFDGDNYISEITNTCKIADFCKANNITPFMFFISVFYIVLYKYSSQTNIVIGTPTIGRNMQELSNIIGMFVNTMVLEQKIDPKSKFVDFVKNIKEGLLKDFEHQDYPFSKLVNKLDKDYDKSHSPLFDILFSYENNGLPNLSFKDLKSEIYMPNNKYSKFDITFEITPVNNTYQIRIEYCTKLYSKKFIENFFEFYTKVLNLALDNPQLQIKKFNVLKDKTLPYDSVDLSTLLPKELKNIKDLTLLDLFEYNVNKNPNKVAIIFENNKYTYKQISNEVNSLANYVYAQDGYRDIFRNNYHRAIGIIMNRSYKVIVAMLASLKLGCAYIPIDPNYPDERVNYILENSNIKLVLTNSRTNLNSKITNSYEVINVDNYPKTEPNNLTCTKSEIAYLIYTSGSTGKPKGVEVTHNGLINFILGQIRDFDLNNKTIISVTTISFDIFILESILPLCANMSIVFTNDDEQNSPLKLNRLCNENNVNMIQTTPSKFKLLIESENDYVKNLKYIWLAGEPFPLSLLNEIKGITNSTIINGYGPSETTVWSTYKDLTNSKYVTIGKPVINTKIKVLDQDLCEVPNGIIGTLYIGGSGVGNGYYNNEEITRKSFINIDNEIYYNTSDLVKKLENGELEYIGRSDFQVKLHGLRIELPEIEKNINQYRGISNSVVVVKNINNREVLCGYYIADGRINNSNLKNALAKKLPRYMIPTHLFQLNDFPYTPNGKIDRKALPMPIIEHNEIKQPKTRVEKKIYDSYKAVLSIDNISIEDNFFDIGGDSLLALKLQLELTKFGINVSYSDLFEYASVKSLAKHIEEDKPNTNVQLFKKSDFCKINKILRKNSLYNLRHIQKKGYKDVLLVGATGYLGAHILSELLKIDYIKIHCIVRPGNKTSPEQRLKDKLYFYFGYDFSSLFCKRIFVYSSDVTKEGLSLNSDDYAKLGNSVSMVLNSAANVRHYGYYSDFKKVNVTGVENLVKFCEDFNLEFYQISTISVSASSLISQPSDKKAYHKKTFTEKKLFISQDLSNVYVRSKFEAEKLILEHILNKNLKATIFRIGNLTNRYSDGRFQENADENAFINRVKAFIHLKAIPSSIRNIALELSPVDTIASAIVKVMEYDINPINILHAYNPNSLYVYKLLEYFSQLNINFKIMEDNDFSKLLIKALYHAESSDSVSVLLNDLNQNDELVYKNKMIVKDNLSQKIFNKIGISFPILDKEYIEKMLNNL